MRVLLTTDPIGGVWTFTKELGEQLLGRGHAVALASFGRLLSCEQSAWCLRTAGRFPEAFRYEVSASPLEWMNAGEHGFDQDEELLLRIIDDFAPDLLHSNQFCFGAVPVEIPRLITAHSDVLSWAAACKPEGLAPSVWLDRYTRLVQAGLNDADAIVAPTRWMLAALGEHFQWSCREHVVPNGRDVFSPKITRRLQAVTCGRLWDEAKNLEVLEEVAAGFPILVAGEREHDGVVAAARFGNASIVGSLEEYELLALFRASSIYVATSRYEPFGLAPLEAALCGCAVVANDIPSLREVWGDAALYFRGADELTAVLARLHDQPWLLAKAQGRSQRRARKFSAASMAAAYERIYMDMIYGKAAPASPECVSYA